MKAWIKRHKIVVLVVIVLAAGGTLATVWFRNGARKASADRVDRRQNTVSLERMDLTKSISATGTVESCRSRTVSADVTGATVKRVKAAVGDEVKKGDVLVTFDTSDYKEELSEAKQSLQDARSEANRNVTLANEQLASAKKALKQAKSQKNKAETGGNSTGGDKENTAVSTGTESSVEQYEEKVRNAENEVETAEANREKSLREAQKQVDEVEKRIEKCTITAPIGGIVTLVGVQQGDSYSGGTLFQLDDTKEFTVTTAVDEYDISSVQTGQRVVILTEATGEDELEGKITSVAPSTGSTSASSGASQGSQNTMSVSSDSSTDGYEVKISVDSKDERLKMGLTAKCSIIIEEVADVYAVPYDAVHENEQGESVISVMERSDGGPAFREVKVTKGMESDYYVEISGEELSEGMMVQIPTDETDSADESDAEDVKDGGFEMPEGGPGGFGGPSGMGGPGGAESRNGKGRPAQAGGGQNG